jgi:hypothetical protein
VNTEDAYAALVAALGTVEGLRAYDDPGAQMDPPAAIVSPPALVFGGPGPDPVNGQFVVMLVVPQDDRSLPRFWSLLPLVVDAVESVTDAVVTRATPGFWQNGGVSLPCYEISVEMSLN